jgi:hypothetical protein
MDIYKNLSGSSGITRYQIEQTEIVIEFKGGKVYKWSYESAGRSNIEQMKAYALTGSGLNSFIMKNVKLLYVK